MKHTKNEYKVTICGVILFLLVAFASTVSVTEFTYDFNKTQEHDTAIYYAESMQLVIHTPFETACFYTVVEGATPSNEFDVSFGTEHEKTFEDLEEGLHKYYIQCENTSSPVMEISFKTKKEVSADIAISKDSPLKDGTYDITLVTSKQILGEPTLEYSFDGSVYSPIPLSGDGTVWTGHLIIGRTIGEVVGSFRFEATDLDGKEGTTITGDKIFIVDTDPPQVIQNIDATGYVGEIKLSWFLEEEVKEFNIYRSENPGIDFTDFHTSVEGEEYTDTGVSSGKTYYYKVAGVDDAGNIAGFSREVFATALLSNASVQESGLDISLLGKVDNFITEVNLLADDIRELQDAISLKDDKEQEFFTDLNLDTEYRDALSEIASVKNDADRFKSQDLTENELDKKLSSASVRIDILKKRVPESVTLVSEESIQRDLSEETITTITLEYAQNTFTEKEVSRSITQTKELLEGNEFTINSELSNLDIVYLDGTRKKVSLFKDTIQTNIERDEHKKIVLVVPKEVAKSAKDMSFGDTNLNYEVIKDDPVLAFDIDTQNIIYTLEKHTDTSKLADITMSPIHIYKEEAGEDTSLITGFTGFAVADISSYATSYVFYIVLGVIFLLLILYFLYMKRRNNTDAGRARALLKEHIKEAKRHKKEGKHEELQKTYKEIQETYKELSSKHKKKHYATIKKLHEKPT